MDMMDKLKHLVKHYGKHSLDESQVNANPILQFKRWMTDALEKEPREPNAMLVTTVDARGRPSARIMLLKEFDERGFVFYTNYQSRKAVELTKNPYVSLCFWWPYCERQVRIEGQVEKISQQESDAYFNSRSRESRLGALASRQSHVIANRKILDQGYQQLEKQYASTDEIPRPDYWGGYRTVPDAFEFWQGGPHRLHDRLRYEKQADEKWQITRLAP